MTPDKDFWAVFPEIRLFETRIIKVQAAALYSLQVHRMWDFDVQNTRNFTS